MKLLITRPLERIEPLKSSLEGMGHEVVSVPLFRVIPVPFEPFDMKDYDGVIVTSTFALPFVPEGANLIYLADRPKTIGQGRYIYLRGEHVTQEIDCDSRVVYTSQATDFLQILDIDGVLLFSGRTAQIFEDLWEGSMNIEVFCLSPKIAEHLLCDYKRIHVSEAANLEGMLDLFLKLP